MLTKSFLIWAMHFAAEVSGLGAPTVPPEVTFVSESAITEGSGVESAFAYYDDFINTIYMPSECYAMETLECKGVLVHEMVHYLQDINGKFPQDRDHCVRYLETLAYRTEDNFYRRNGKSLESFGISDGMVAYFSSCGNDYDN